VSKTGFFPEVKRPELEADHSPSSSAEVKEYVELYLHSPKTHSYLGTQLKKKKRNSLLTKILKYIFPLTNVLVILVFYIPDNQ
jgi:hypothetical protein